MKKIDEDELQDVSGGATLDQDTADAYNINVTDSTSGELVDNTSDEEGGVIKRKRTNLKTS